MTWSHWSASNGKSQYGPWSLPESSMQFIILQLLYYNFLNFQIQMHYKHCRCFLYATYEVQCICYTHVQDPKYCNLLNWKDHFWETYNLTAVPTKGFHKLLWPQLSSHVFLPGVVIAPCSYSLAYRATRNSILIFPFCEKVTDYITHKANVLCCYDKFILILFS